MPYPGVPKARTESMERCVSQVIAKGKEKDAAIAICKTSILGNATLALEAATEEDFLTLQAELADTPSVFAVKGEFESNAILKFEGARLAVAEVNGNRDGIDTVGIRQLADTIRLMPLTLDHEKEPRGIFTRGYTDEDSTETIVDGFIWAGMFPDFADEIRSGYRKLSIDADADLAVCSICGTAFQSAVEYCEHMRRRDKDAVRWLFDLRSVAGGAVVTPAGTDCVFPGKDGFVIISHKDEHVEEVQGAQEKPNLTPVESEAVQASGGASMKVKCTECDHEFDVTTDAEEVQSELEAKISELEDAQAKLVTAEAGLVEAQNELDTEQQVTKRFVDLVVSEVGIEAAQLALPSLRKMDDETFEIMKSMAAKVEPEEEDPSPDVKPPKVIVAAGDNDPPPEDDNTWNYVG